MSFNHLRIAFVSVLIGTALSWTPARAQEGSDTPNYRMELEERPNLLSPNSASRELISREATPEGTLERWVVEIPSINGGYGVLLEVEEETVEIDDENSRFMRREYDTDGDGRRRLIRTVDEERVERADGSAQVLRDISEPDLNGRPRPLRREVETTVQQSPGVYRTEVEVQVPGLNRGGFVASERREATERRDSEDRVLEQEQMTYSSPVGGQGWIPLERRQVNHTYREGETESVEQVYQPDASGNLALSERMVSRSWADAQGRERTSDAVYARDVPGLPRSTEPQLYRQVDVVSETRPNGSRETTREVREFQVDRMRVIERVIERSRPDGRGGMVTERELQQADANGRLRTVSVETQNESGL